MPKKGTYLLGKVLSSLCVGLKALEYHVQKALKPKKSMIDKSYFK